ncbi:TPA: hypothetical protein ENX78_05340 [Candidatus Poribacteria bacterium]|nr:hypothetical protein [Candidatus Poribacteria bacterium]
MKVLNIFLIIAIGLLIYACSEDVERENPLDVLNQRTGGVMPWVTAKAGDSQITLSWDNMGFKGIKEYRIYRAHLLPENFELIATVPASDIDKYTYTDKGLLNDGENVYYYRVSYVDSEGIETPDPKSPKNLASDWSVVHLIPSLAPPPPDVQVVMDTDLMVRLVWEGYSRIAPPDLAGFKVYIAPKAEKGQEQEPLKLVAVIDDPKVEFYNDGNDYARNIINFRKDGVSKLYKVVAYDKAGVESESPILVGTSPNLPPNPPSNFKGSFNLGLNNYQVRLEWTRSPEPDVIGYKVYALLPDGTREFKGWKNEPNDTVIIITDRYVIVNGEATVKQYYVTAFDNTVKQDGTNDESAPSAIVP